MRQPLLRHAARSIFLHSPPASACPHAVAPTIQGPRQALTCIQRRYLSQQRRHFADEKRSTPSGSSSSEPINLGAPPTASQQSQPHPSPSSADSPTATDLKQGAASSSPPPPPGLTPNSGELPSASERRRSHISKRLTNIMDNLQGNIFLASQHLNDLTGYSGIEALKRTITAHEQHLEASQEDVRVSRQNYKQLVADRAASQREVTTLLARKDTWTPIDLERFTSLYRSDHGNEHAVQEATQRLADAERTAEQAGSRLNAAILARYHEEQIWSDKIRRMSTWGTWGLMGVNVLLFLVFQFGFEPWRRERLTKGFEDKVLAALEREREVLRIEDGEAGSAGGVEAVEAKEQSLEVELIGVTTPELAAGIIETTGSPEATPLETEGKTPEFSLQWRQPNTWKEGLVSPCVARVQNLFSEEKVSLRKQDVTLVALEGLATGAAVAGLAVMYILRPN
ncbi:sensitivity to high expression protein she9 [Pseudogymnoascus destructans]|uniref:Sensitive to high expression protein 9, mitochondrial n=2 Tax=Pseudogymnoascus destructans TaxID=655981 RepID=L8FW16_PSED2|nr:sensitivity to high expression protein she9 [Pseudogymnoascus destructans]ELR03966.1 hypothetical protein GMDG_06488 [Pseudogymnoascus destructans 20631-21]OAF63448.1 sensitivity to high expression protein she9 [Pseudogymnoascus destructans]